MDDAATAIDTTPAKRARPLVVYLVTEDWYFLSHRLPMARAALAAGYDVHVVTHVEEGAAAIEAQGFCPLPAVQQVAAAAASHFHN